MRAHIVVIILLLSSTLAAASASAATAKVAVLDLSPKAGFIKAESEQLSDILRSELVKAGAFTVLERGYIAQIMEEQELSLSAALDDGDQAVQIGKLAAADYIVVGSIGRVVGKIAINARMIDVGSGKVVAAESIQSADDRIFKDIAAVSASLSKAIGTRTAARTMAGEGSGFGWEIGGGYILGNRQYGIELEPALRYSIKSGPTIAGGLLLGIPTYTHVNDSAQYLPSGLALGAEAAVIVPIARGFCLGAGFKGCPHYINLFGGPELIIQIQSYAIRVGFDVIGYQGFSVALAYAPPSGARGSRDRPAARDSD